MPDLGTIASPTFWGFALAAIGYFILMTLVTRGVSSIVFWLLAILGATFVVFRVAFLGIVLPVAGYVYHHPVVGSAVAVVYVLLGIAVALSKWRTFSKVEPLDYRVPPKNVFEAEDRIKEQYNRIPKASRYKSTISRWISTWPIQVLDYLVTTLLHGFFTTIAEKTEALFNRVALNSNAALIARYQEVKDREVEDSNKK